MEFKESYGNLDMVTCSLRVYNTVPHQKLLHKMRQYGVDGNINAWLCDFLTNTKMPVVIDGEESKAAPADSQVPQGIVLGPPLFLCHIKDLPDSLKSKVWLFADNCLLYRQIKSREDNISLQYDFQNLETWGMHFNAKKCYIMGINIKSTNFYQLDGHILQEVPVV